MLLQGLHGFVVHSGIMCNSASVCGVQSKSGIMCNSTLIEVYLHHILLSQQLVCSGYLSLRIIKIWVQFLKMEIIELSKYSNSYSSK